MPSRPARVMRSDRKRSFSHSGNRTPQHFTRTFRGTKRAEAECVVNKCPSVCNLKSSGLEGDPGLPIAHFHQIGGPLPGSLLPVLLLAAD